MPALASPIPGGTTLAASRVARAPRHARLSRAFVAALAFGCVAGAGVAIGQGSAAAAPWSTPAAPPSALTPLPVGYGPDNLKDLTEAPPGASKDGQQAEAPADPIGPPAPIDNWHAFDLAFQTCLQPLEGPQGAELTLKFGLDAKGRLRGKPIASHSRMTGTREEQRAFVADALANLARCLPLPLTQRFGPIVASRPLILRFQGPRPRERGV